MLPWKAIVEVDNLDLIHFNNAQRLCSELTSHRAGEISRVRRHRCEFLADKRQGNLQVPNYRSKQNRHTKLGKYQKCYHPSSRETRSRNTKFFSFSACYLQDILSHLSELKISSRAPETRYTDNVTLSSP